MKRFFYAIMIATVIVVAVFGVGMLYNKKHETNKVQSTELEAKTYTGELEKALGHIGFNGSAILVKNNKVVDSYTQGNANDQLGEENTLETSYEIDSLQKSLTAGLVMQQVNLGNLNLTDKVSKYIPDLPGASEITIRQLLNMTSGLSLSRLKFKGNKLTSAQLLKRVIENVKFNSNNIGKWSYQPVNFMILSEIIEKVSGTTYAQLFNKLYTKKLGLNETEMAFNKIKRTDQSTGYILVDKDNDSVKKTVQRPNRATIRSEFGTGQVYMSVTDFYKVLSNLLNGKLLGKKAAHELYVSDVSDRPGYYGGLYTSKDPIYRYANGFGYGFQDHVRISQNGANAVIVFSNYQHSGNGELKKAVDQLSKNFLK